MKKINLFLPKERLENLCDAIFAVTMTLMILELKTPDNIPKNLAPEELPPALLDLIPAAEAYVVSFIILGTFWLRHQIQFRYLKSIDLVILITNIFFLLFTGLVPFSVELMKKYPDYNLPFMIYVLNLLVLSIILLFQWFYISKHDELIEDKDRPEIRTKLLSLSYIPIIIFLFSFLISFINIRAAFFVIYSVPFAYLIYNWKFKKKSSWNSIH